MTGSALTARQTLGADVTAHLELQLDSARRLLGTVLAQGAAIRRRDVQEVLRRVAELKTETALRARLEEERTDLLVRAGAALGVPAAAVTLEALATLLAPAEAHSARNLSAELQGLLAEIGREHGINRALMRQELAFLDHLVRLVGQEAETGYGPDRAAPAEARPAVHRVLDLQA